MSMTRIALFGSLNNNDGDSDISAKAMSFHIKVECARRSDRAKKNPAPAQ
jgi:hypothetical protein